MGSGVWLVSQPASLNTAGLTDRGRSGANGGAPTYAAIIDLVRQVGLKKNYARRGPAGFLASTKAAGDACGTSPKTASWGFIWDDAQDDRARRLGVRLPER
jgi:hypothetical protein